MLFLSGCDGVADVFSKEKRSEIMSKIRNKWTSPEKKYYDEHPDALPHPDWLPFKPDFLKDKIPIFLDSTFWHGYVKRCKYDGYDEFWSKKLFRNIMRDVCRDSFWGLLDYEVILV